MVRTTDLPEYERGLLPEQYEASTVQVAGLLDKDLVDAAFLTPA